MSNLKNKKICEQCVDAIIERQPLSDTCRQHIVSCDSCKTVINTLGAIALQGSAYNEDLTALKLKVFKHLIPIMEATKVKIAPEQSIISKFFPWFMSFALAGLMLVMFVIVHPRQIQNITNNNNNKILGILTSPDTFKMALNNTAVKNVSLDEPVILSPKDKAVIIIPDGSELDVKGPARLNINPRGFHLITGFLTAKVKKGKIPFISTTPQGQIQVMGTIYNCKVAKGKTTVSLKRGLVKVIPDNGKPILLKPGESTTICSLPCFHSESIPPINKE